MYRVRFAPSPTGHPHIGNIRVAIFNWLFARHHNGIFLVRIEDTDLVRSKQKYVDSILSSLRWLDLMPDEPLVYQASRVEEHKKVIKYLLENGLAYPCFCEPRDVEKKQENLEHGIGDRYDGTCRNKSYTEEDLSKPHAIRFKLPNDIDKISFNDLIRGEITFDLDQLDDFVILRRDGTPTYNFCVVLDDLFMKISHVIRGEDHISNTPKQILIYKALNANVPEFAHLPLILGPAGNKLSKRDAAVFVVEYKEQGFLPDALFNYLVRIGWAHGDQEIFSKQEMVDFFSLGNVGKKGGIFDIKKLLWLNGVYIRNLKFKDFLKSAADLGIDKKNELTSLWNEDTLNRLFELYKERSTTIVEMVENIIAFAKAPEKLEVGLIKKWLSAQTPELLNVFLKRAFYMEVYNHDSLFTCAKDICNEYKVKLVALAQPLRLALTGKICSPGVFELITLLSAEECQKRISKLMHLL